MIPQLEQVAARLEQERRLDSTVYSQCLPQLPQVLATIRSFQDLLTDWPEAADRKPEAWRTQDSLLLIPENPEMPESAGLLPGTVKGTVPRRVKMRGHGALLFQEAKWNLSDEDFRLSGESFSILAAVTPTRFGNNYFTQLLGIRATYREFYPGYPGWGLGLDGPGRRFRFTVEDENRNLNFLSTPSGALKQNEVAVIVAVRDREQGELRLYLNGELVDRTAEKGDGFWTVPGDVQIGYDNMGGGYFAGGVHKLQLLNRVATEEEIAEFNREYHGDR